MVDLERHLSRGQAAATMVVASATATKDQKNAANFICDGVADDAELQAALNILPTTGGKIVLTDGTFTLSAQVARAINNVTFQGAGNSTIVNLDGVTPVISAGAQTGWLICDLVTDAGGSVPAVVVAAAPEHHLAAAVVDVTVASTTVPYQVIGPMPVSGTITGIEVDAGENKTCGATSAIFDVHKILAASRNTDGQGTTLFTTQGNRPTISNGNRQSTTTAPDVTSFAAGDMLAYYVDQSGTTLTVATIGVRFTIP